MVINFESLREQLTDERIKDILHQYDVDPVHENEDYIIFPTCCHNLSGGSPKLYYYKNSKRFHCFTECNQNFDIFDLLRRMHKLRGQDISVIDAINLCGLTLDGSILDGNNARGQSEISADNANRLRYLQVINSPLDSRSLTINNNKPLSFRIFDKAVLKQFSFDYIGLLPWIEEGIGIEALQKFNIRYDKEQNAIIIPNFDINGDLIGIRARFLNAEDIIKGKYRPLYWRHTLYNYPVGRTLYGIYENQKAIRKSRQVIIFEGEKSVLKMETRYHGDVGNIAVATLGQNITRDHISILTRLGVRNIILAYDSDYQDARQLQVVEKKYRSKAEILAPYFNVSYLMDYDFTLPYKSSPIDGGREAFEHILKTRQGV